jgi:hypothetical protein
MTLTHSVFISGKRQVCHDNLEIKKKGEKETKIKGEKLQFETQKFTEKLISACYRVLKISLLLLFGSNRCF